MAEGNATGWTASDKTKAIAALQKLHVEGQKLEMKLRVVHGGDGAEAVWASNQRLAHEIDVLIGRAMDAWGLSAAKASAALTKATDEFKAAAAEVKKSVELAAKIVKLTGYLDDAVKVAAQLAKATV